MICKWCGNAMDNREKVCRRCGNEVPAKSDCGGFYDLVPAAGGIVPPAPVQLSQKPAKKSAVPAILGILCCVLLVAVIVVAISGNSARQEADQLKDRLESAQEEPETVALDEREYSAVLGLEKNKDGSYSMKAACPQADSVVITCTPEKSKLSGYTARLTMEGEKDVGATLKLDQGKTELILEVKPDEALGDWLQDADCSLAYVTEDGKRVTIPREKEDKQETAAGATKGSAELEQTEPEANAGDKIDDTANGNSPGIPGGDSMLGSGDFGTQSDSQGNSAEIEATTAPSTQPSEATTAPTETEGKEETDRWEDKIEYIDSDLRLQLPYDFIEEMAAGEPIEKNTTFVLTLKLKNKQGGTFTVVVEGITVS